MLATSFLTTLLLAPTLLQQQGEALTLRLDGSLQGGSSVEARISSTLPLAPVWLAAGPTSPRDILGLGQPLLGVNPYGNGQFARLALDANGQADVSIDIPGPIFRQGKSVAWQAITRDSDGSFHASRVQTLMGEPSAPVRFASRPDLLASDQNSTATSLPHVGDFDRDGDEDMIILTEDEVRYLRNDAGQLVSDTVGRFPSELEYATDLHVADFNLDGAPDLVFVGRADSLDFELDPLVLLNDGNGVFSTHATLTSSIGRAQRVHTGDVDGDGDLDILASVGGSHSGSGFSIQVMALFRNQGRAQGGALASFVEDPIFADDSSFNNDDDTVTDVVFGDVDRDGDLDIFAAKTGSNGAQNELLLNDGSGGFSSVAATQLPAFNDKSGESLFEDFTGDGYPDIFVTNSHWTVDPSDSGDLLINGGASNPGVFVDADPASWPDLFDEDLIVRIYAMAADVDQDGDRDLIVIPHEFMGSLGLVGHPELFLNQGGLQNGQTGDFVKDTTFWPVNETFIAGGAVFSDFDLDGDLDFMCTSIGGVLQSSKTEDFYLENLLHE